MNDASTSGSDHPSVSQSSPSLGNDEAPADATGDHTQDREKEKRAQRDQVAAMLDHLIRNIDILIYAQLSVLYYMDCSFLYFFLRVLTHWFYFTPKPFLFPPQPITYRPYIAVILGVNMLCLLSHLIFAPPAAGEATRGYLHGGLLIDFVGQKSPVKRWQFMGLDILVLVLQVLVLGVTIERRAINTEGSDSGNTNQIAEEQRQDHDFEERGMLRQRGRNSSPAEEYEMHTWARDHEATSNGEDREHDIVSQQRNVAGARDRHPLDPYYTGEHVIANLYLINTIRAQWQSGSFAVGSANASTSSVRAAVAAAAAGRTLTSRLSEGIQNSG